MKSNNCNIILNKELKRESVEHQQKQALLAQLVSAHGFYDSILARFTVGFRVRVSGRAILFPVAWVKGASRFAGSFVDVGGARKSGRRYQHARSPALQDRALCGAKDVVAGGGKGRGRDSAGMQAGSRHAQAGTAQSSLLVDFSAAWLGIQQPGVNRLAQIHRRYLARPPVGPGTRRKYQAQGNQVFASDPSTSTLTSVVYMRNETQGSQENLGAFELVPKIDPSLPAQERERATFSRDEYLTRFDPWDYVDEHPVSILRLTKESYIEHVAKLRASNHERGRRAREVFKSCMLRRTYNSCIDGTRISDDMPVVQHNIIECRLSDEEFPRYKEIFRECMSKLHRKRKDDVVLDTNVYRQLLLVGTWLNCEHILDYKVNKLREFRKANRSAYDILKDVQSKQKSRRFPPHLTLQLPEPNDKEGILKAFCRGSPKLRALAELIADLVLMRKEKVVVWCTLPAQQLIIEKFLREAGIDARDYHAGLNLDERTRLTKSFNTSDGVVVLIRVYFMSETGSNWQFFCYDAIMFDEAPSKSVDDQALGRIRRVGQRSYVRVYRLYMLESFDEHLRSRLIVKALPGLMTELNMDIFGVGEHGDEGDEVILGDYVLEDGKLVSLDDLPCNERDDADVLPADELLMLIQKSLRGDELKLSAGDKMALAKSR
ncbi:hypothetical protein B0J12DRAFT_724161 [Macrophomina phaseolina]|uniref:Helicase C-terminal domain-containing protein n=1 Tax=Macrophomina phaseolina TaxID=35725 RepID=A0ABQ8GPC2_9PEZI|nr:hypothetical protein B0J12DRAFT_724161 [Macrophomina phaseolina]